MKTTYLAQVSGLSVRRINQLIAENVLPKTSNGAFPDQSEALAAMFAHFNSLKKSSARLRLETAQASREELKLARERGLYVALDDVTRVWSDIIMTVRQAAIQMPGKLGSRLSDSQAQAIAQETTNTILTELSRDFGQLAEAEEAREAAQETAAKK